MSRMAARIVVAAAKNLLVEETSVIKTAVQTIRTTATEEISVNMGGAGARLENSVGRVEIPNHPNIKEFDLGKNIPEIDLPSTKKPDIQLGEIGGKRKELDLESPDEVRFPDAKRSAEVKPGDKLEQAEKEAKVETEEQKLTQKIANNVPADPSVAVEAIEQGRRMERPEVGDKRAVTEVERRNDEIQESTEDGVKQLEVETGNQGPEVGSNVRDTIL